MKRRIHLISPAPDCPTYFNLESLKVHHDRTGAFMMALALPAVAALVPEDLFEVSLCDEAVTPVDFDVDADFIGLTAMINQWQRAKAVAAEFRRRGKIVVFGGPHASLCPDTVRPHCDILVRGEFEEIAEDFFRDLARGQWKREYVGTKCDLTRAPAPRLDLYPNDRTLAGAIQTSRGCPFRCEFCDVILYQGRKQRYKSIPQVLTELENMHAAGYGFVCLVDDNLTANRRRAKALLRAIADWNAEKEHGLLFSTQISIEAADDEELLGLMVNAGVAEAFVGIETPNTESLAEVKKVQNTRGDLAASVRRFIEAGITVMGGMVVGFDADGPDIFRQQLDFAMSLPVPIFTTTSLFAPLNTPLYNRLAGEGRILPSSDEQPFSPWGTNFTPRRLDRDGLAKGVKWLCNHLFDARNYEKRVRSVAEVLETRPPAGMRPYKKIKVRARDIDREYFSLIKVLFGLGHAERMMALRLGAYALRHPRRLPVILKYLTFYQQIRHMLDRMDFWDPELAGTEDPQVPETGEVTFPMVAMAG